MSWLLVLCLLGTGGVIRETKSADGILEINKNLISGDDPLSSFLYEGDIITHPTSKFDSKRSKWPWVNGTVQIPYNLSDDYDEQQRNVIFEAFKDLENSTCIRFVERKNQQDYISIVPGNGCYSNVGRCGHLQVVSLASECIRRGKGVVLHELMHVIGFWHEHSRADRDDHVIIHYSEIMKGFSPNFCKFQTSNMIVPYDYDSLLHYSSSAFAKSKAPTIEPRNHSATIGQRVKLSKSDILRINKLYHCPQYVPSEDDKLEVVEDLPSGGAACPEDMHDILTSPATVLTTSMMAESLSLEEVLSSSTLPPTESSKTSPDVVYSSSPESKPGTASSLFSSQESKSVPNSLMYSHAEETTHQLLDNQGSTVGSTITEGCEPKIILQTSDSLLKTANEETTNQLSGHQTSPVISNVGSLVTSLELNSSDSTTVSTTTKDSSIFMPETTTDIKASIGISTVNSSVNSSELTSFDNTIVTKPLVVVETKEGQQTSIIMPETTDGKFHNQLPNNQTSTVAITLGSSVHGLELDLLDNTVVTAKKVSVTEAILPTSIFTPKTTIANIHIIEENGLLQTSHSANSQSSETQQETKTENQWSSSGSGEVPNVTPDQEYVKETQQETNAEGQWSSSGSGEVPNVSPKQDQEYVKETQQETNAEGQWSSSGSGEVPNVIPEQDQEYVKENLHIVRKRSLAWKTFSMLSDHHPRGIHGKKLTISYNNRRESSEINKPFCGFEHGFCGWKQSTEDDLDWRLGWGSLNVNTGHFRPEGFHLTLKNSSEGSVSGQKALLLRPIDQPYNCISFWYGSRNSVMGTLNVYITSSGREETLLWSSGGQEDHVKWTKAQIMLPPNLLSSNAYVVVEGVIGALGTSTITLDDLYVGQCS